MKQEWYIQNKKADFNRLAEKLNISPVTVRLIRNRGIITDEEFEKYLYGTVKDMYDPFLMKDVRQAVDILKGKIATKKRIRIIGDYDIDGVCASHILATMLLQAGAIVDVRIPHRIEDGYGISKRLVKEAKEDSIDTIITCDNGIAATDVLAYGKELGLTIIVTDHHEIPYDEVDGILEYSIPKVDAVINPKQQNCSYPYKELCGAVVAYKLGLSLLIDMEYEKVEEVVDELLVFCALATVGDIMPLTDENRIIVKEGLKRIGAVKNLGLRALINVNQLSDTIMDTYHFGFIIGPCINAAGRLGSAMDAYELFAETDASNALQKAIYLKELNGKRKDMTQAGVDKAIEIVEAEQDLPLIFVYLEGIHESVAGIVAGKLKEKYNKPAFVITDGNGILKGSARSIEAYSMYDKMNECKELFIKFGGHKMAAGFSLEKENFDKIKSFLIDHCQLSEDDFVEKISVDFQLPVEYISKPLLEEFSLLAPFGNGNSEPLFVERDLDIYSLRKVGEKQNVMLLDILLKDYRHIRAVYFKDVESLYTRLQDNRKLTCCYAPKINEYKDKISIQLNVEYFR